MNELAVDFLKVVLSYMYHKHAFLIIVMVISKPRCFCCAKPLSCATVCPWVLAASLSSAFDTNQTVLKCYMDKSVYHHCHGPASPTFVFI